MREVVVRRTALAVATFSLVVGASVFIATDWALEQLPDEAIIGFEAFGQLTLYLLLVLVLAQSYRIARQRVLTPPVETPLPHRETATTIPIPGDDLAAAVESIHDWSDETYETVRRRLERLARDVLERRDRIPNVANGHLADGSWTDDTVVRRLLDDSEDLPPRSLGDRIRLALGCPSRQAPRTLRRSMSAIARTADLSVESTAFASRSRVDVTGSADELPPDDSIDSSPNSHTEPPSDDLDDQSSKDRAGTSSSDRDVVSSDRTPTGHWHGVTVVALVGLVVGISYQQPPIIVAAAVGIGFAAYANLEIDRDLEVTVERVVSDANPKPGDDVDVVLTVRNDGDRRLADLRLVDGVPPDVAVTDGSPKLGTSLAAGESTGIRYTITARRGTHEFEPVELCSRPFSGASERLKRVSPRTITTITCEPVITPLPSSDVLPLRAQGMRRVGSLATADPASGLEFHSVREYQPGDSVGRIDWNRYARTKELSTVSFHDERSTVVVVCIDTRKDAYYAPKPSASENAVDRSVTGAGSAFVTLLSDGHSVGLASISPEPLWLAPGTGGAHRKHGRLLLTTGDALDPQPPASTGYDCSHLEQLSSSAQLLLFSPLCDDTILGIVQTVRSQGTAVTIVSPDPTTTADPARAVFHLERSLRIDELRGMGVLVVDWAWDRPLEYALRRTE